MNGMEEVLIFASLLAPIILAVVELFKRTFVVKNNFIPLMALVVGLVIGLAAAPFTDLDIVLRLWAGGLAGLAGTGLYELGINREGKSKGMDL